MTEELTLKGRSVFVTGGTGFIGARLVTGLVELGANVTVLARDRKGAREIGALGVHTLTAGMDNEKQLLSALEGTEIVFNLAYDVRATAVVNLANFDKLLRAAIQADVQRIVHVSSIVVYDDWPSRDLTEESPVTPGYGSPYRRAKVEMERRLSEADIESAVIQPTLVYGPGSALWTDHLADMLAGGTVVLPKPEGRCNAVFVDDVVQAMTRAAVTTNLTHDRFIISGASSCSWSDLLGGYAEIIGRGTVKQVARQEIEERLGPAPEETENDDRQPLAARVSAMGRMVLGRKRFEALVARIKSAIAPNNHEFYPDHHLFGVYTSAGECRIDHAREVLGYDPQFGMSEGLAATRAHLTARFSEE